MDKTNLLYGATIAPESYRRQNRSIRKQVLLVTVGVAVGLLGSFAISYSSSTG